MMRSNIEYEDMARRLRLIMLDLLRGGMSGHLGGSLSLAEILTVLYHEGLANAKGRLILSKGHAEIGLYALLLHEGILAADEITRLKKMGSVLQGHPSKGWIPWLDYSGGSLGQGLSFGMGMAIALLGRSEKVFVILGDGELQEGQVWEAVLQAPRFRLGNLIAIVDMNGYQLSGETLCLRNPKDMEHAWQSMGWEVFHVNGHDIASIRSKIMRVMDAGSGVPQVILASTVKGMGITEFKDGGLHCVVLTESEIDRFTCELKKAGCDQE